MGILVENRPTITAMVQARTPERTIELIKKGLDGGADAFGIQLETLEKKYHNAEAISKMIIAGKGKPFYLTHYRYGSNEGMTDYEIAEVLVSLADFDNVIIDVMGDIFDQCEYQITYNEVAVEKQKTLIKKIQAKGAKVLMSSHTNCYLPADEVFKIAAAQQSRGVDISKVVTMANSETEQLNNFSTSALVAQKMSIPTLFLCAGTDIYRHRRMAPFISNNSMYLCVVEYDDLATPAQPLLSQVKKLVDALNGEGESL